MLQECCTKSFFFREPIVQPSAFVGDVVVCGTCAQTCCIPSSLKPRTALTPVVCACASIPDHECLFDERASKAADQLTGAVAVQAKFALQQAASQSAEAQLAGGQQQMTARINSHCRAVLEYEQPEWQAKAREVIPMVKLLSKAQEVIASGESTCGLKDEVINQLLHWFKHEVS